MKLKIEHNLFCEDNRVRRRIITILAIVWLMGAICGVIMVLDHFTGFMSQNLPGIRPEATLKTKITVIVFTICAIALSVFCFISRNKPRFKYSLVITNEKFVFTNAVKGKKCFSLNESLNDFESYEIIDKYRNYAKLLLKFTDTSIEVRTGKFSQIKQILDAIIQEKRNE